MRPSFFSYHLLVHINICEVMEINRQFWENGPSPGGFYEFPNTAASATMSRQRTLLVFVLIYAMWHFVDF